MPATSKPRLVVDNGPIQPKPVKSEQAAWALWVAALSNPLSWWEL